MHVWIVEFLVGGRWIPTIGCQSRKPDGKKELRKWKERDPDTQYKLQKYIRPAKLPW